MRAILLGPAIAERELKVLLRSLRIQSSDVLVGVDGGVRLWQKCGYQPQFAVGDWDSLEKGNESLSTLPHITLSKNKERSDLFFAGIAAIEAGAEELVCLGVTGSRPDHHFAMLSDLSRFSTGRYGKLTGVQAKGMDGDYYFLSEAIPCWQGSNSLGKLISIFAINGKATGISLSGFQFGLKNAVLSPSSQGLSNRARSKKCEVRLRKGQLLVIIPRLQDEVN